MKTYWFTIGVGERYRRFAADLCETAASHGVDVRCLSEEDLVVGENAKFLKLRGMREVPDGYDRVAFIDADTLFVNADGFALINGALKEPWGMGNVPLVSKCLSDTEQQRREAAFWKALRTHGLAEFCPGGRDHRQEWNSGVIVGSRAFMHELAEEWEYWWRIVLDICDGEFLRDQVSFKAAYTVVARRRHGFESIPVDFNCIVKRNGFRRSARILHYAGAQDRWDLRHNWSRAKRQALRGAYRSGPLWSRGSMTGTEK